MSQELTDEPAAEALIAAPAPAWILKHSLTCGISSAAYAEYQRYLAAHPGELGGVVMIQRHRPLSNWLATRLKHTHQSPQLFLVQAGKVLWTATHWGITSEAMEGARKRTESA